MYRYRVVDSDGDKSAITFDFDIALGRIHMEPRDMNNLIALSSFRRVPTAEELINAFEEAGENAEEASEKISAKIKSETLLTLMRPEWCEFPSHLRDVAGVFQACQKMCLEVTMVDAVVKHGDGDKIEIPNHLPKLRFDNLSFLWDAFVYYEQNKESIKNEISNKLGEIMEEFGKDAEPVLPWDLKFWVLPVKIYDDIDNIVTRVPYEVMHDLYEDALSDKTPIDVTDEIQQLLENRKNRNN